MAKPIPVFAFVFAAFAATSTRAQSSRPSSENLTPSAPRGDTFPGLLETWRLLWRRRLGVSALVGVVGDGRDRAAEALWLSDVRENGESMIGAAAESPRAGERIDFVLADVLDWRIVEPQSAGAELSRAIGWRPSAEANPGPSNFSCAPGSNPTGLAHFAPNFNVPLQISGNASISLNDPSTPGPP